MFHLLSGLHTYLTRKETYSVLIVGLDASGKSTLLEQVKALYIPGQPQLDPSKIGPTVGQGVGKITLPSTILQFWDLGGQRDIRSIWNKYYDDCQAIIYVVDASDASRLEEGWTVFDQVLASPQTQNLPLLLLANKQDLSESLSPTEIRESYEKWYQAHRSSQAGDGGLEGRGGSLEVLGVSALQGTGVREAIDWLFIRVRGGVDSR